MPVAFVWAVQVPFSVHPQPVNQRSVCPQITARLFVVCELKSKKLVDMSENRKRKFKEDHVSLEKVCTTKKVNTKVSNLSNATVRKLEPLLGIARPVEGNQR